MRTTFHLVPEARWRARQVEEPYEAPSLATEAFIHCTDGVEAMVATANRFYAEDPQAFLVLTIDLDALTVPWRYDEPGSPFPHIYGPLDPPAVLAEAPMRRAPDGRFLGFEA